MIATLPVYTNSEDGLYGPAIDNDFATNKWVYLYYAPQTVENVKQSDGTTKTITTPPNSSAPTDRAVACAPGTRTSATSSSAASSSSTGANPTLDLATEQKILRVSNNRGACCHVAGDIDFDTHNNLWLVTGDDTPSGGGNSGGFSPHNDMKTDETQTVRVTRRRHVHADLRRPDDGAARRRTRPPPRSRPRSRSSPTSTPAT